LTKQAHEGRVEGKKSRRERGKGERERGNKENEKKDESSSCAGIFARKE